MVQCDCRNSPSLTTSTPAFACRDTTSATERVSSRSWASRCAPSRSLPASSNALGRIKLPTCVVKMRCSLRFMAYVPRQMSGGRRGCTTRTTARSFGSDARWRRALPLARCKPLASALIARLVLGKGLAQILEDRTRILAGFADRGFPIGDHRFGGLSPGRELIGAERIDVLAGHGLDLAAAVRLEIRPWRRDSQRPIAGAVRIHHLLLRRRQRIILALVQDPNLLRDIEGRVDVILGDLVDAEQQH